MQKKIIGFLSAISFFIFPPFVFAHEAYVLTRHEFQQGLKVSTPHPLAPLFDQQYMHISVIITVCVIITYTLVILWATTPWAAMIDTVIKKGKTFGPIIIRIAISASFFYAAFANAVLGPELSLETVFGGSVIRFFLFTLAIMIFFGIFTELAALIGLIIFAIATYYFQAYMITYANYFGELLVLFLFGSRFLSFDQYIFGKKLWVKRFERWKWLEVPIVRILYGVALMYAGWTIKFEHQQLSVMVYHQYHLQSFFHAGASFIAAGAGLSEIIIGLFILLGFAMRFTILISLFFITASILYFREMLWPHFMLYGISFSLLINAGDKLTLDRYVIQWVRTLLKKLFRI